MTEQVLGARDHRFGIPIDGRLAESGVGEAPLTAPDIAVADQQSVAHQRRSRKERRTLLDKDIHLIDHDLEAYAVDISKGVGVVERPGNGSCPKNWRSRVQVIAINLMRGKSNDLTWIVDLNIPGQCIYHMMLTGSPCALLPSSLSCSI